MAKAIYAVAAALTTILNSSERDEKIETLLSDVCPNFMRLRLL